MKLKHFATNTENTEATLDQSEESPADISVEEDASRKEESSAVECLETCPDSTESTD
jgi:hypothetical protein